MAKRYIYKISNRRTGDSYIGCSINPFKRWEEHVGTLRNNQSGHPKLQDAWTASSIFDWDFSILEEVSRDLKGNELYRAEGKWIEKYRPTLNIVRHQTQLLAERDAKHEDVVKMIRDGKKYRAVRDALGVPLGTITNIMRKVNAL